MTRLSVSLACGRYDRTVPIHDGTVKIDGCWEDAINILRDLAGGRIGLTEYQLEKVDRTRAIMDEEFWSYGVASNQRTLKALF